MATHEIPWDELPEFPLARELLAKSPAHLPKNDIRVPAGDKKTYLATQYSLIRHEGLELLRQSIAEFRAKPTMRESCVTAIYTQVIVRGYQLTRLGTFCRISFCPSRADKRIRWATSDRLTPGALVALSPVQDCFRTVCRGAVVAQRLLVGGLEPDSKAGEHEHTPPRIDISWAHAGDAVLDPMEEMVMIEAKSGFYEAVRYAMLGLQNSSLLESRFDRYLVAGEKNASTSPQYLKELRYRVNVASICNQGPVSPPTSVQALGATFGGPAEKPAPVHIDITAPFPENTSSVTGMDMSQLEAIRRMISSEIAIIQGPPGTGKTFVSVAVIKILLQTLEADAPIVISAHTNHALDQLLNHIRQATEVPFVRLGRRSNNEVVNNHTLFRLRRDSRKGNGGARHKIIESRRKRNAASLEGLIRSVSEGSLLRPNGLLKCNLLTQQQHDSLILLGEPGDDNHSTEPLRTWLGGSILPAEPPRFVPTATQWEDVQDPEARGGRASSLDDDERDLLTGQYIPITQDFEVDVAPKLRKPRLWATFDKVLAQCTDLYRVRPEYRGAIYHHLRRKYLAIRTFELQELLKACKDVDAESLKAKAESDAKLIRSLSIPIVGCTTTGLTKYRELIGKLKPRILLIEEAAETREANISSALVESLEQLILVGDHRQLAPSTDVPSLAGPPYNLGVSLFERLVNLGIDKTVLNVQRRMIPEIRCVLRAIYPTLTDHPSVLDRTLRPPVPGMGSVGSYFFCHDWPEHATTNQSKANREEAAMVAGFVRYLVQNGTAPDKITVLTFYRGQRTGIRQRLHQDRILGNLHPTRRYNVCTVDGYQGEENDVVVLSLVRSPGRGQPPGVGFVASRNRAVVAVSRARRGFYVFGNYWNLVKASDEAKAAWKPITEAMIEQDRCHGRLPVTCQRHGNMTAIRSPSDWGHIHGGCRQPCNQVYVGCGHRCTLLCHPASHDRLGCKSPCARLLPCGHKCSELCGNKCECANKCKGNNASRNVPRPEARTLDTFASFDEWMRVYAPEPEASASRLPGAELKFFEDQDSSSEDDDEGGAKGDEGGSGGSDSGIARTEVVGGRWADGEVSPGEFGAGNTTSDESAPSSSPLSYGPVMEHTFGQVEVGGQAQRRLVQDGPTECTPGYEPARSEEATSERAESIVGIDEFLDRMGIDRTSEEYDHEHKHEHKHENEEQDSGSDCEGGSLSGTSDLILL